jgi:adenine-specific DNA-methyltransferase
MKLPASDQKLRGGYYTPRSIARFLTDWAIDSPVARVLEPSSGGGVFLGAAAGRLRSLGSEDPTALVTAVELDDMAVEESRFAMAQAGASGTVHHGDFFQFAERAVSEGRQFDVALGNPPFLRFQYFRRDHQEAAFRLMRRVGLNPNRLTNAWVPFIVASAMLLGPRGRLAMVVPAELLQVSYAAGLRRFLSDYFERVTVITFDKLVFEGIQQEVVLLCAEREASHSVGIRVVEVADQNGLDEIPRELAVSPLKALDHSTEKWTQYFLEPDELEILRCLRADKRLVEFGELASVDVGIVTGMNDFFVMSEEEYQTRGLAQHVVPIVTRSNQLTGAAVNELDWAALRQSGKARYLLHVSDDTAIDEALAEYIHQGETSGLHEGYKCRIRRKWWVVPSVSSPDAFMLRQVHLFPRLSLNTVAATSTDTVHRVRIKPSANPQALVAGFHNSATFLFAEAFGRSYGGGVLELEPSEADRLLVPYQAGDGQLLGRVDRWMRDGDQAALTQFVDQAVLTRLGYDAADIEVIRRAGTRLRLRRVGRKQRGLEPTEPPAREVLDLVRTA